MICPINECGRKIGLIDQTTCKCNKCSQFYCKIHRLAEDHKCSYNFKEKNEEEVRKYIETNKCVSDKMVKI